MILAFPAMQQIAFPPKPGMGHEFLHPGPDNEYVFSLYPSAFFHCRRFSGYAMTDSSALSASSTVTSRTKSMAFCASDAAVKMKVLSAFNLDMHVCRYASFHGILPVIQVSASRYRVPMSATSS